MPSFLFQRPQKSRSGFSVVELLVVIGIISVLMALISAGVFTAMRYAQDSAQKWELTTISESLEAYKNKYGAYPPDFSEIDAVYAHLAAAFPDQTNDDRNAVIAYIYGPEQLQDGTNDLNQTHALYFFLSGLSADLENPFIGTGGPLSDNYGNEPRDELFEFKAAQLKSSQPFAAADPTDMRTVFIYLPSGVTSIQNPIVYFNHKTYGYNPDGTPNPAFLTFTHSIGSTDTNHYPHPYLFADGNDAEPYCNPNSFQLITAGRDELYDTLTTGIYPGNGDPTKISIRAADNITNFSTGTTLGS
ncbi:MAG: type II secretion system GspH family protein [Pirellulaceae bacterium]|nr:type II secretion system GspH family protein [Pirellulaceae bacterium]